MSRDDYNELLEGVVDHATDLLTEDSEFSPFALAMQPNGEVFLLEPEEASGELSPEEVVMSLRANLRASAAERGWKAIALAADVTLEDEDGEPITSAIHVALEHLEGEPTTCVVPYEISGEELELGELMAEPGEASVLGVAPDA